MKALRILVVVVATLAGALAIIGLLLPGELRVQRSTQIGATPEQVYGYVAGFGRFNDWSPWADLDPQARFVFSGPDQGPGARMEWHSAVPEVGSGSQEVVAVVPGRSVSTRLVFDGQGEAVSTMRLAPAGSGTRATWEFDMALGMNPVNRWIGLIVDKSVGADHARGLDRLKALVEAEAAAAAAAAKDAGLEEAAPAAPGPGVP